MNLALWDSCSVEHQYCVGRPEGCVIVAALALLASFDNRLFFNFGTAGILSPVSTYIKKLSTDFFDVGDSNLYRVAKIVASASCRVFIFKHRRLHWTSFLVGAPRIFAHVNTKSSNRLPLQNIVN